MSVQEKVSKDRIRDIVEVAALRNTPIALTCRLHDTWQNFRSQYLGLRGGRLWVEYPQPSKGSVFPEVTAGCRLGVAFKQRHHKYVFSSAVEEVKEFRLSPDVTVRGLSIGLPQEMYQLQRRMFHRVDVPDDRKMFVRFWQGGLMYEPLEHLRQSLEFTGQVVDLSAGGFRVRMLSPQTPPFDPGDPVGAELTVEGMETPIHVDCQFRHADMDEFGVTLGMQMVGLTETPEGRKSLQRLSRIILDFQRGSRGSAGCADSRPAQTA